MNITLSQIFENAQNELVKKITHEVILDYFQVNDVSSFLFNYNYDDIMDFLTTNYFMINSFSDLSDKISKIYTPTDIDQLLSIYIKNEDELNLYANDYIKNSGLQNQKFSHKEFITIAIENYLFTNLYLDDDRIINSLEEQFDIFIFEKINYFLSLGLHFNDLNSFDKVYDYLAEICSTHTIYSLNELEKYLYNLSTVNY